VGVPAISKHLNPTFEEGELTKEVVISILEITTQHGVRSFRVYFLTFILSASIRK